MERTLFKYIDFFIKDAHQLHSTFENRELLKKSRLITGTALSIGPLLLISTFTRASADNFQSLFPFFISLYAALGFFMALMALKLFGNYKVGLYHLIVSCLIIFPLGQYARGGLGGTVSAWSIILPALLTIAWTERAGPLSMLYLLIISTIQLPFSKFPLQEAVASYATINFLMIIATVQTSISIKERQLFAKYMGKEKEREILCRMIATLNHEINNPLAIASLTIEKMKRLNNPSEKDISVLIRSVERLKTLVQELNQLNNRQFELKRYSSQNDLKIYDIRKVES